MKLFVNSSIRNLFAKLTLAIRIFVNIREQGSALIITLLVVMVISSIGAGVGRLTISEIKQTNRLEDSAGAQAAAESGIEHGLLLYRFNHGIQLSDQCTSPSSCTVAPTESTGTPKSFDMGNGVKYELKIWYKGDKIGNPDNIDDPNNPKLKKDQTIQISGLDNVNYLTFKFKTPCTDPSWTDGVCAHDTGRESGIDRGVEIKRIGSNGEDVGTIFYNQLLEGWDQNIPLTDTEVIRIKPWDTDMKYTVEAIPLNGTPKIDAGITYIESTGYFGNTKRKLQVKIDRASGLLLGTYDFVLYSGTGNISQ